MAEDGLSEAEMSLIFISHFTNKLIFNLYCSSIDLLFLFASK